MTSQHGHRDIDAGWAWVVLFASYFNLLLCSGLAYVAGMFQLVFLEQFQGSVAFTSWVTALFSSLMQLAGPLSSMVSNCYNCRVSVLMGGVFMSVGLFISSLVDSLGMLFVTFGIVAGVGIGMTYTASIVIINIYFVKRRTLVTGIAFSASGLGIVLAPQISQLLFDNFSWREALVIMAGASAQICVTGALMFSTHESKVRMDEPRPGCCGCLPGSRKDKTFDFECIYDSNKEEDVDTDEEKAVMLNDLPTSVNDGNKNIPLISVEKPDVFFDLQKEVIGSEYNSIQNCISPSGARNCYISEFQQRTGKDSCGSSSVYDIEEHNLMPVNNVKPQPIHQLQEVFIFDSLKDFKKLADKHWNTGSHQELTLNSNPRIRELRNGIYSQSHQELSNSLFNNKYHTSSNPNLIRRLGNQTGSGRSIGQTDSLGQIMVISRNASLLGLVPSTIPLGVIVTRSKHTFQSSTSLRSNSILESTVVLTELSPLENADLKSNSCVAKNGEPPADTNDDDEFIHASHQLKTYPPLYRNTSFCILCLSLFVGNAGCGVFTIHLPSFLSHRDLTDTELIDLLSIYGLALLIGRCLCAALANSVKGNDLLLYWALNVLGGVCICFMPLFGYSFISLAVLIYGVGSYYGTVYAVLSPITIQMVGLSGLATAFGIEMVCAGLGYLLSPPLAGVVVDLTSNYDYSMYSGGLFCIIGGMIALVIPVLDSYSYTGRLSDTDDDENIKIKDPGQSRDCGDSPDN